MIKKYDYLLGKQYEDNGGDGINTFNCATLVEYIIKSKLCELEYSTRSPKSSIATIKKSKINYIKLDKPENWAIVTLGKQTDPHHIGVFLDGYVIHADRKMGVVFSTIENLKINGFWNIEFWKKNDIS